MDEAVNPVEEVIPDPLPVDQPCLRYNMTQEQWLTTRTAIKATLTKLARRPGTLITYTDLRKVIDGQVERYGILLDYSRGHINAVSALLADVSVESYVERGVFLGALVVSGGLHPNFEVYGVADKLGCGYGPNPGYEAVQEWMMREMDYVHRAYSPRKHWDGRP